MHSAAHPLSGSGNDGLVATDISIRFGGIQAVDGVSLTAPRNRITGLIGPNGAGKTTTFNICSGLLRPDAGQVAFNGHDVTRRSVHTRARLGLGRTFQRMQLFESLTVAENVALGREAGLAGASPLRHLAGRRGEEVLRAEAAEEALELCGIAALAGQRAGMLSTGQRRLVELARALAGDFTVFLLDEPSSGLDRSETDRFGALLQSVVATRGCGMLLVEHDMRLALTGCSYIYVLDFGRLIFEGPPDEVRRSPVVRAAYLGGTLEGEAPTLDDEDGIEAHV